MKITNKNLDFFLIARSGQCFRMHASDALISLRTGSRFLEIQRNGPEELDLSCSEDEFPFWAHYLDLNGPYAKAIRRIPKDDPYLLSCASCCRGLRILRQDPFETLISFIISQRKAIPAIQSCVEKLCRLCGEKDEKGYAFPTPQAIAACSLEELATCSLGYRAPYVRETARLVCASPLPNQNTRLSDERLM
jgi:N-glycosylase/DNA lyase